LKKKILTKYGRAYLEVRHIRTAYGTHVFVLKTDYIFPEGNKTPAGKKLKEDVKIERGAIFLPHWNDFGKPEARRIYHIFENGLYEAIRGITHALFGYGTKGKDGELKLMQEIASRLVDDICILMLGKETEKEKLDLAKRDLAQLADDLENVTNEPKREAKEKIARSATLKIERGGKEMTNLPATVWRLSAAETRIQKRINEILTIAPRLVFFEQTLIGDLSRIWFTLEWLRELFATEFKRMEHTLSSTEKMIFGYKCGYAIERLKAIDDVKPFCRTVELIQEDLKIAKEQIEKDQLKAKEAVKRILSAVRFKDAQKIFEGKTILPFTLWQELDILTPARIADTADKIEKFAARVKSDLDETGFISPPKKLVLEDLRTAAAELRKPEPDTELAKELMKRASNLL
jgi:hypothetical protein